MLFNSTAFIFLFLPATFLIYFILSRLKRGGWAVGWLIACSIFFYAWWRLEYVPILLGSLVLNYGTGRLLDGNFGLSLTARRLLLFLAIVADLGLLFFFKYALFVQTSLNAVLHTHYSFFSQVALPLGISFFTFQQITYLVDVYRGVNTETSFRRYSLFVVFFPHLIAGPLVHHNDILPQFKERETQRLLFERVARGLFVFSIGLAKKNLLADPLAPFVSLGFDNVCITLVEAWMTSLAYTLQLYFDFSGYCDMAIGAAEMFNVRLPANFASPYRAVNIQEFWRRWHITLGAFLRDYVYIPLGGSQGGKLRTSTNLLATFVLGGLWHGAGWTFLFWGLLHGLAMVLHRLGTALALRLPRALGWFITFHFVNIAWVFFRAPSWTVATRVVKVMAGWHGVVLPPEVEPYLGGLSRFGVSFRSLLYRGNDFLFLLLLGVLGLGIVLILPNSNTLKERFKPNFLYLGMAYFLFMASLIAMSHAKVFLYYDF